MHRYYRNEIPEVGDHVVAVVTEITDLGTNIELLEYGGLEAAIPFRELTRSRRLPKHIKPGLELVAMVVEIDKGFIMCSKHRVYDKNKKDAVLTKYHRAKECRTVLNAVISKNGGSLDSLYPVCWQMQEEAEQDSMYNLFTQIYDDQVDSSCIPGLYEAVKARLVPRKETVTKEFTVTCFSPEGIDAIKEVLNSAQAQFQIEVKLVRVPKFSISQKTDDVPSTEAFLESVVEFIETEIANKGGALGVAGGGIKFNHMAF